MDTTVDNVVRLDDHRPRPFVQVPVKVASTGSRPFLCRASDGKNYWCKQLNNAHGREAVINEIVASAIGDRIGAPVRPWAILDVPSDFAGTSVGEGRDRYRLDALPVFGSVDLHEADIEYNAFAIDRDGNYDRFPRLAALWLLCNAEDIQLLYDYTEDMKVWSVDHGLWFGSQELPWQFGDVTELAGRTILPEMRTPIAETHWERAITGVDALSIDILDDIKDVIPDEWNVKGSDLNQLVHYAISRKHYATEKLRELQRNHARRR